MTTRPSFSAQPIRHRSIAVRAMACLWALAASATFAAPPADDWQQAQAAFAELDDRAAFVHLQRAAAAGDSRAQQALALAYRHGDRLFPGVLATDLQASARWQQTLGAGPLLPASAVPPKKHTQAALYVNALRASAMKEAAPTQVVLLDIRSRAEAAYVGMPTQADALVPFRDHEGAMTAWDHERHTFRLQPNPAFEQGVAQVLQAKGLDKTAQVVLICRSGDRSAQAADLLHARGYFRVYSVVDGFEGDLNHQGRRDVNGWKNAGLPWTYQLDKAKVAFAQP